MEGIQPDGHVRREEAPIVEADKIYKLPPAKQAMMFKMLADSDPFFWPKIVAGILIGLILGFILGKVI